MPKGRRRRTTTSKPSAGARRRTGAKRGAGARRPTAGRRAAAGFRCPDCGFQAAHAMGLGRHRSARHGVVSKRASREGAPRRTARIPAGWLTREQAAERAGVHVNTIRNWERQGRLRQRRAEGTRAILVSADDVRRAQANPPARGRRPAAGGGDERLRRLEKRVDQLVRGLERLVASARG